MIAANLLNLTGTQQDCKLKCDCPAFLEAADLTS